MKPQQYWKSPVTGKDWLTKSKNSESERLSAIVIPEEFAKVADKMESVFEVGAGNGRLIGALSKKYPDKRFYSMDINEMMSSVLMDKYDNVLSYVDDITTLLSFKDNQFDFVFTFQVLQHVSSKEDIMVALNELKRITKKKLLLIEGWGNLTKWKLPNGHQRHTAGGGTYYWNIDELVECEETKFLMLEGKDVNNKMYFVKV